VTEDAEIGEEAELEEPEDISGELAKTVKDLRAVKTINALSKGSEEQAEKPITAREALELKKIETMFPSTGGSGERQVDVPGLLEAQERRLMAHFDKVLAEREATAQKDEKEFYKKRLEEKEAAETRAREIAEAMAPLQEQMSVLNETLEKVVKREPESKPPVSAELEAIRTLGGEIRGSLVEIAKTKGGETSEKLKDYLDSLGAIMDKITEMGKGKGETSGEFDWRTAGISTFGEVATEAIRAYREIEAGKPPGEGKEEPGLSSKIVERRVYNHAMKKIAEGQLTLNPYEAAEELGLTPTQVWRAVESLRERGALRAPAVGKGGRGEEKRERETEATPSEGEVFSEVEG